MDSAEEAEKYETEKSYQVPCFISQDIKYMHTGIKQVLVHLSGTMVTMVTSVMQVGNKAWLPQSPW